ncbi:hypothetical protein D6D00_08286 [Aureobasidium pullulans]|nr:hypothetical protein D6D00_08286 [Aureobasidium pullulans]
MDLKKVYAQCIEHKPHEPMPDKHTVAQRYLAQVNNIISVGEALVQTDHVSESGIIYLVKAVLATPWSSMESPFIMELQSMESWLEYWIGAPKSLHPWTTLYMRSVGDGVTSIPSRALQELLLLIWSGQGLDNVQSLAHETRENAATIQSTLALNVVGKERTTSDFSDMASAITRMLQIRTAGVLSQIDSIVVHAVAARVMESYIDEISARSGPLFKAYKEATSVEDHSYGNEGTRDSYRLFVIEKAIPVVS